MYIYIYGHPLYNLCIYITIHNCYNIVIGMTSQLVGPYPLLDPPAILRSAAPPVLGHEGHIQFRCWGDEEIAPQLPVDSTSRDGADTNMSNTLW